jgi:predicted NBD/HSP70 family sugar kinase
VRNGAGVTMEWTMSGAQSMRLANPRRGTTQQGVRAYNERLALSLIRSHGSLPKAEIARLTGLSAQTVSVIVRQLERDGLLLRQKPRKGKVGQPLVPFSLNPDGAFFAGLKIGRRSFDLMLLDLAGKQRAKQHKTYAYPTPKAVGAFLEEGLGALVGGLSRDARKRIAGIGVATPFELWNWEEAVDAPKNVMEAWRGFDIAADVARLTDWPVHLCNDATAACAAELVFGAGHRFTDFVYFFVSYFIGGGVVLNGTLFAGRGANAGALGSMPVPAASGARQLIELASLHELEKALAAEGRDPSVLWRSPNDWGDVGPALDRWIARAATAIAHAAAASAAVVEAGAIIIDGAFPATIRTRLVDAVRSAIGAIDLRGLSPFEIVPGTLGSDARAMGAASLPLLANFVIDRDVLFKEPAAC